MRLPRLHGIDSHVPYFPPRITLDNEARFVLVWLTRLLATGQRSDDFACVAIVI